MTIKTFGTLLKANLDDRVLTYRLLPFGETGRTSAGAVTVTAGAVTIPEDVTALVCNMEHDRTRPVGKFVTVTETDDGLDASVRVAGTTTGDDLLLEASEGLRTGISVEIDNPVIRAGKLLAGVLSGAGFVTNPAFPSAQLTAAEDLGDLPDYLQPSESHSENTEEVVIDGVTYVRKTTSDYKTEVSRKTNDDNNAAEDAADVENDVTNSVSAAAPVAAPEGGLTASNVSKNDNKPKTLEAATALMASAFTKGGAGALTAALVDITHDDGDNDGDGLGEITAQGEWLGNVWEDAPYERLYIPLIKSGVLTSYKASGYRFVTKPVVAKYSGNKAAVPSTGLTAEPVNYGFERWANAADIDRRYVDFSDSEVIAAFIRANVESYKEVTDVETLVDILASADAVTPGSVPTGIDPGIAAIADGAIALISDGLRPSGAIVGTDLYRSLLLTPKDKVSEFLAESFGLESGSTLGFRIVPSAHADAQSKVTVLDGRTLELREFGGGVPVRVEAENVANGGVDIGVFGYTSFRVLRDGGVRTVDLGTEG